VPSGPPIGELEELAPSEEEEARRARAARCLGAGCCGLLASASAGRGGLEPAALQGRSLALAGHISGLDGRLMPWRAIPSAWTAA
jgi:hypothetical protein